MKPLLTLEGRIRAGALTIFLPNGRSVRVTGRSPGRTGEIRLNRWRAVRRVFAAGGIGFGEAYMDGMWSCHAMDELFTRLMRVDIDVRLQSWQRLRLLVEAVRQTLFNLQSPQRE